MDLVRAFTFFMDDRDWVGKMVLIIILTAATLITLPFFGIGLGPLAVLLGYSLKIINNVRDQKKPALPTWDDFGDDLGRGLRVLPALILYNLPFVLMGMCVLFIPGTFPDSLIDGVVTLMTLCCGIPLMVLYIGFTWPMLAAGMARYARGAPAEQFFHTGRLFEITNDLRSYSIQWVLLSLGVLLLFSFVMLIPCVGWLAGLALLIPVQAHLIGQYARQMDAHQKRKNAALRT